MSLKMPELVTTFSEDDVAKILCIESRENRSAIFVSRIIGAIKGLYQASNVRKNFQGQSLS